MDSGLISKSTRSRSNLVTVCIGIFMLMFFGYLFDLNFQPKNIYQQDLKALGFILLTILTIYCVYYLLNQKRFYIYEKHFEIKTLFKSNKYIYKEIKTHYSEDFEWKYNTWTEHYLVLNTDEKITIVTTEYHNFHEFFYEIKLRIKKNKKLNTVLKQPKFLNYAVICGIIALLLFYFSSFFYDFGYTDDKDYSYITTVLQNDITFAKNENNDKQIEIEVVEHKDYNFILRGSSYEALPKEIGYNETFKSGDEIAIGIEKDEFNKKISKTIKTSFLENYFNSTSITIHQIKDVTDQSVIDLEKINQSKIESNYLTIGIISIFGLLFSYLSYGNYTAYLKAKKTAESLKHI